jgi:hypothetical protein
LKSLFKNQPVGNAFIHIFDATSFFIGMSLCSFGVIVPAYVKSYTKSVFLLALIPIIIEVGKNVPQILMVFLELKKKKRNPVFKYFLFETLHRISFILIGIGILIFVGSKTSALLAFYALFALSNLSWGLSIPNWADAVSVTLKDSTRADFMGKRDFLARVAGILASLALPFILGIGDFPYNYGYLFLISGFIFTIGAVPIKWLKTQQPFKEKNRIVPESFLKFVARGVKRLVANRKLRGYLIIFWVLAAARITHSFFTPYVLDRIISQYTENLRGVLLSGLNTSLLVFMALNSVVAGWVIHRFKHKTALFITAIALALTNSLVLIFPNYPVAIISTVFYGLFMVSIFLVVFNTILDFTPHSRRSLRLSFFNIIDMLAVVGFSLLGGWIASMFNYEGAMWFVVGVSLISLVFIARIKE